MKTGVLYIVSGEEYAEECLYSARSLKKYAPSLPVQVISTAPSPHFKKHLFDFVDLSDPAIHPLKAKVKNLLRSRFDRTLFLDADTVIKKPLDDLFDMIAGANLSMTYDNLCDWNTVPYKLLAQESRDLNTGFIVYDRHPVLLQLFADWDTLLSKQDEKDMRPGHNCDQVYFNRWLRDRILNSNQINTRILPNTRYNVRPWCWEKLKAENQFKECVILHAHHLDTSFLTILKRKMRTAIRK